MPRRPEVRELNNQVGALLAQRNLAAAGRLLEQVGQRLADAEPSAPDDLAPVLDEYFYCCHASRLAWEQARYAEGLPHAERALALERRLAAAATAPPEVRVHSFAHWACVSLLTRCRRFDEALAVFAAALADARAVADWLARDRAGAERVLLAGLCLFFEAGTDDWIARAGPCLARAEALVPAPLDVQLAYAYACLHARHHAVEPALVALARALSLGLDPQHAAADHDLAALRPDPRFVRMLICLPDDAPAGAAAWTFTSTPPGALVWIDGTSTGVTTPARLRPRSPGRYRLRFTLAGHRAAEHGYEQPPGNAGWTLEVALQSLAEEAAWQRADEDAAQPAEPAARERTRTFLGPEDGWRGARMRLARAKTYGLGSLALEIRGDGTTLAAHETFAATPVEHRQTFALGEDVARALLRAFVEAGFTEMRVANRPGRPDEPVWSLELESPGGQTRVLHKFASHPHERFEGLVRLVQQAVAGRLQKNIY